MPQLKGRVASIFVNLEPETKKRPCSVMLGIAPNEGKGSRMIRSWAFSVDEVEQVIRVLKAVAKAARGAK